VDTVLFTHMHLDHVGWTSHGGTLTFPNARYLAGEGELEFWQGLTDADLAIRPDPDSVQTPLKGRMEAVRDGQAVASGVNVLASPGHTPGHCSVVVSSGSERAIIMGDVLLSPLQITQSDLGVLFDVDPATAARTRDKMAAELAGDEQAIGANGHFSGSVFGRVIPAEGRAWVNL
jgi:glyoxylase-like metal-dependent hydrolase (beta-lactamase superfamily II)